MRSGPLPPLLRTVGLALLFAVIGSRLAGATPDVPIALALTLNDGGKATAYRGWPLIVRADAVITANVPGGVQLDRSALALTIVSSTGAASNWPLRPVGDVTGPIRLNAEVDSVRLTWLLTAEQSAAIPPGTYVGSVTWAGRKSPGLKFSVVDAPASLDADDRVRRAQLRSEVALLSGDVDAALAAVQAEPAANETIALLLQLARIQERRGEFQEMLRTTQRALTIFRRQAPKSFHPPEAILDLQAKALAQLVKPPPGGFPKANLKGTSGSPRTVPPVTAAPLPTPASAPSTAPRSAGPVVAPVPAVSKTGAPSEGTIVPAAELNDEKVRAEVAGQWASAAIAGSFQNNPNNYYTPARAIGEPKVVYAGYNTEAWCPAQQNTGEDWLELSFATPKRASGIRVRQTFNPGAIVRVEAIEPDGTLHLWWQGNDPYKRPATREIAWFAVKVPPTPYLVAKVRLSLNLAAVPGWKQIDAVQLVSAP